MNKTNMSVVLDISNTIKKIRSRPSFQRADYLATVKRQFKIEENEKWVVTKLRMILFKQGANLNLFQLGQPQPSESNMKEKARRTNQKDIIKKKTARINSCLEIPASREQSKRKPRLSLEEKQFIKLRSQPQNIEIPILLTTKDDFLGVFNLVEKQPKMNSAGQNVGEGQKEAENMLSKIICQKEQNICKVNVLKVLWKGEIKTGLI